MGDQEEFDSHRQLLRTDLLAIVDKDKLCFPPSVAKIVDGIRQEETAEV